MLILEKTAEKLKIKFYRGVLFLTSKLEFALNVL